MTGYFDDWDFRPYVTAIPVKQGTTPKGAVVLMAGGAYQFRGNYTDALPTAAALRECGYQTFIVDYRLEPYSQEEGALDVARAVRYIRRNADVYGIDPDNIAVMGFSAGGIQAGEFLIQLEAWAPFGEGRGGTFDNPVIVKIAEKYGKTPAQIMLRWHIQRGIVVIPKSTHIERMEENFNVFDFVIAEEDMKTIAELDKKQSSFFSHQDPKMVEWFVNMVEERKKNQDSSKEKKNW